MALVYKLPLLLCMALMWEDLDAQCTVNDILALNSRDFTIEQLEGHWSLMRLFGEPNKNTYSSYTNDIVQSLEGLTLYNSFNVTGSTQCTYMADMFELTQDVERYVSPSSARESKTLLVVVSRDIRHALFYLCDDIVSSFNYCNNPIAWVQSREASLRGADDWLRSFTSIPCFDITSGKDVPNREARCPLKPFWGQQGRDCRAYNFSVHPNFNLTKYMGLWYEISWLGHAYVSPPTLYQDYRHVYELLPGDNVTAHVAGRDPQNKDVCRFYTINLWQKGVAGAMMFNDSNEVHEYNVIYTDYDHYSVVYECSEIEDDGQCSAGQAWLRSRYTTLPNHYRIEANRWLQWLCVNPASMLPTEQIHECVASSDPHK